MKNSTKLILACVFGTLAALLIVLILFVDVSPVGPEGTSIGLSHINLFFFRLSGVHMLWYDITDWLGVAAVLTAFLFAVVGFIQMIKRKSLFKVDVEVIALGGLYVVLIGLYILFENVIVNYRPIIMPGCTVPEASFPSSHTLIVCGIMGSTYMLIERYVKASWLCMLLKTVCAVIIAVTVVGRLVSGVHWLTDILGGILISSALLALYSYVVGMLHTLRTDYPHSKKAK